MSILENYEDYMNIINIFRAFTLILAASTISVQAEENQEFAKDIEKVKATNGHHVGCSWYDGRGCKAE